MPSLITCPTVAAQGDRLFATSAPADFRFAGRGFGLAGGRAHPRSDISPHSAFKLANLHFPT